MIDIELNYGNAIISSQNSRPRFYQLLLSERRQIAFQIVLMMFSSVERRNALCFALLMNESLLVVIQSGCSSDNVLDVGNTNFSRFHFL